MRREIRFNTAHVDATVTATLDSESPVTVSDEDTAAIAVDSIPQTGEQSNTMLGWGLGLIGSALMLAILRRRYRKARAE